MHPNTRTITFLSLTFLTLQAINTRAEEDPSQQSKHTLPCLIEQQQKRQKTSHPTSSCPLATIWSDEPMDVQEEPEVTHTPPAAPPPRQGLNYGDPGFYSLLCSCIH